MKRFFVTIYFLFISQVGSSCELYSEPVFDSFYANNYLQLKNPLAFVLQPQGESSISHLSELTNISVKQFVKTLKSEKIDVKLKSWSKISIKEQYIVLGKVFKLQVESMNIKPPKLIIEDDIIQGSAYFDFDLANKSLGRVLLNPKKIAEDSNPYLNILLLIHETRHAYQLAQAFENKTSLQKRYMAAFEQQKISEQLSFSDFLTLINEYEAFQFANAVIGEITNWHVSTKGLGTFASQFDKSGKLKINLPHLFNVHPPKNILPIFNVLQKTQYEILKE